MSLKQNTCESSDKLRVPGNDYGGRHPVCSVMDRKEVKRKKDKTTCYFKKRYFRESKI